MNRLLIVPALLFVILFSLISMSYLYPNFVTVRIRMGNEKYFYNVICFTLNISEERIFDCYYIINITKLKILNTTYNVSYSFYVFSNSISKEININIPISIANKIENYHSVRIEVFIEVIIVSSLNTIVKRIYQLYGNFTNNYLEYKRSSLFI